MNYFSSARPFVIAGPCGAESPEQLHAVAQALKSLPVNMLRAGVWKPRSKPGHFEGHGEAALAWLADVQQAYAMPVCVEVANPKQVELALQYGMKALWLGARTTVNPFLVQEICEALSGVKIPVLVKNPVNPDVDLWSGALERLWKTGLEDVGAVHRGFSSYDPSARYRNKPMWAIPIELKRRYPALPVLCDPSHIAGRRELVGEVCQRALDLDFDGLMIEVHPDPEKALSDAAQQITPAALGELLQNLTLRQAVTDSLTDLENLRQVLDTLDAEVVALVARRMDLVKKLAAIKEARNMPIFQQDRWREIVQTRTAWGEKGGLDAAFMLKLFELIHDKSIRTQFEALEQEDQTAS